SDASKRWLMAGYWQTVIRPRAGATRVEVESAVRTLVTCAPADPEPRRITIRLYSAESFFGSTSIAKVGLTIISIAGLLLVAACANLANMLFARGAQRSGEVAVRLSLGASRVRIFRLFLIESALLS